MLFDLSKLRDADEHVSVTLDPAALERADDVFQVTGPSRLVFDIHKDNDRYHVVGKATAMLSLSCSRCLEPFTWPIEAPFDLQYMPQADNTGDDEREIEDEDLSTAYYRDQQIDLADLAREQFYLALPMKPLCRDACRGLCPSCGVNLNESACPCGPATGDPRWAALRALRDEPTKD